jgi:hypothetical protein
MLERVRGKGHPSYVGREVDSRWLDFENFYADMGDRPEGCSIERIDNDKGYGPENCKWATQTEQVRNRSITSTLTLDGVTQPLAVWSEQLGINYNTLNGRIQRGWDDRRVLTQPLRAPR